MNKKKYLYGGVTLIEIVLYFVLFSIIFFAVANLAIFLSRESQILIDKNQANAEIAMVFNDLVRVASLGRVFNVGLSQLENNYSDWDFNDINGVNHRFYVDMDSEKLRHLINETELEDLNSDDLKVKKFYVSRINPSFEIPSFRVEMTFQDLRNNQVNLENSITFIPQ